MAVGQQEFSTSFARTVNHVIEDKLGEDLLLQVMATTLDKELAPTCINDVANYMSLAKEEAIFRDLEQQTKTETSPAELK
jgi:hypothetical protein